MSRRDSQPRCPDCGKFVSDAARYCAYCGYSLDGDDHDDEVRRPRRSRPPAPAGCGGGCLTLFVAWLGITILITAWDRIKERRPQAPRPIRGAEPTTRWPRPIAEAKTPPPPEPSPDEAKDRAEAVASTRKQIDNDSTAVETARAALHQDFQAVVEKALKAYRSVPKDRYATLGEKLKWRTLDREMEALRKKHGLLDGDVEELLKDYPDLDDRNRIR